MQRGAPEFISRIRVSPTGQQRGDNSDVAFGRCQVQGSRFLFVSHIVIDTRFTEGDDAD